MLRAKCLKQRYEVKHVVLRCKKTIANKAFFS